MHCCPRASRATDSNPTRRMIYEQWRSINKNDGSGVRSTPVSLNLGRYLLVNDPRDPRRMSTQQTGNTCYFQVRTAGDVSSPPRGPWRGDRC